MDRYSQELTYEIQSTLDKTQILQWEKRYPSQAKTGKDTKIQAFQHILQTKPNLHNLNTDQKQQLDDTWGDTGLVHFELKPNTQDNPRYNTRYRPINIQNNQPQKRILYQP